MSAGPADLKASPYQLILFYALSLTCYLCCLCVCCLALLGFPYRLVEGQDYGLVRNALTAFFFLREEFFFRSSRFKPDFQAQYFFFFYPVLSQFEKVPWQMGCQSLFKRSAAGEQRQCLSHNEAREASLPWMILLLQQCLSGKTHFFHLKA